MANEDKRETREVKPGEGLQERGRGGKGGKGGQPKPKTPSGERKPWTPPKNDTTPANRADDK